MLGHLLGHDVIGDGPRGIAFLHGILGSRNNWKSFARRFVEKRPAFRAIVVDLRNHGESHGFAAPHTVEAAAADVAELMRAVACSGCGGGDVVVGHSWGGKVALALAQSGAVELAQAWSLDAPPGTRTFDGAGDVEKVLAAVRAVPLPIASRRALVEDLRGRGLREPLAQWMTTNLAPSGDGFAWKFDLAAVPEMMGSFAALDLWPYVEAHRGEPRLVLVRAGRGERFSEADVERAERASSSSGGAVVFRTLAGAGHWLHTDDPEGLLAMMLEEIP